MPNVKNLMKQTYKFPRLYVSAALAAGQTIEVEPDQAHYLKSVLRLDEGDEIRVFNGHDGEWLAQIGRIGKKTASAALLDRIIIQPAQRQELHLLFTPIKKNRLDFLIEKAVELGVTHLHPVITTHTEVRKINEKRLQAQIIEAAEQCERLDLPEIYEPKPLKTCLESWPHDFPIFWAAERLEEALALAGTKDAQAFLIGPEGGFHKDESEYLLKNKNVTPISLGSEILRTETAALACLSHAMLLRETKK